MLTYERAPLVSPLPTVTHSLATVGLSPTWSSTPVEMLASGASSSASTITEEQDLLIVDNGTGTRPLYISPSVQLNARKDYVLQFPIEMLEGRVVIRVSERTSGRLLVSAAMPDALHRFSHEERTNLLQMPIVSTGEPIQIAIVDTDAGPVKVRLGRMQLFELGDSSYLWTRAPRKVLRAVEKLFTTSTMLPLALLGCVLVGTSFGFRPLALVLVVPIYYLLAQSPLHTEPRYVIAIHYFLLIPAALTIYWFGVKLWQVASEPLRRLRGNRG